MPRPREPRYPDLRCLEVHLTQIRITSNRSSGAVQAHPIRKHSERRQTRLTDSRLPQARKRRAAVAGQRKKQEPPTALVEPLVSSFLLPLVILQALRPTFDKSTSSLSFLTNVWPLFTSQPTGIPIKQTLTSGKSSIQSLSSHFHEEGPRGCREKPPLLGNKSNSILDLASQ